MMTSDQERAAPAQQPVADDIVEKLFVDLRGRRYLKWIFSEHGDKCLIERAESGEWVTGISLDVQDEIRAEWRRIAAASLAPSEPELRAEIVRLTRERDFEQSSRLTSEAQLGAQIENLIRELDEHRRVRDVYVVSSQEEYIARCRAEQERDELQKRVEALSAEVGKLTEALEPSAGTKAAYIGEFKFPYTVWDPSGENEITHQVTVPWTTVKAIMAAIRSRAALDKGAPT